MGEDKPLMKAICNKKRLETKVKSMNLKAFEHAEKMNILEVLQHEVFIAGRKEYVSNAIKIYAKSIFDALSDKDTSLIKFYGNEL